MKEEKKGLKWKDWKKSCPYEENQKVRYLARQTENRRKIYRKARIVKKYDRYLLLEDKKGFKVCMPYTEELKIGW